jgi:23S rRNA pseudouridine2605 synthase
MKKKSTAFDKFRKKPSNAAIKEKFRQEKRKVKKEREAFFEEKKRIKREGPSGNNRTMGGEPRSGNFRGRPGSNDNKAGGTRGGKGNEVDAGGQKSFPNEMTGIMPLNKFIAHAGICGRREAAEMVKKGLVKVNGTLITEPGHKVSVKDEIKVNGKKIWLAKNLVYILLNKPKDYITTTDDPQNRKTVLDIVGRATEERVYPVGRLDRNTSGVLLLTNDGELAQKLTHPSNEVKKVYAVTLNKPLEKKDFDQILKGVTLEDGPASVDVLAYADIKDKTQLGVEIHSGRNRIVRRIFESLGYDVKNLDRVVFAGLTKKNVERGKWRFLSEKEVRDLKHFRKGK